MRRGDCGRPLGSELPPFGVFDQHGHVFHAPQPIGDSGGHRRSDAVRRVGADEVVIREVERQRVVVVPDLFREPVREPGEPAHLHPDNDPILRCAPAALREPSRHLAQSGGLLRGLRCAPAPQDEGVGGRMAAVLREVEIAQALSLWIKDLRAKDRNQRDRTRPRLRPGHAQRQGCPGLRRGCARPLRGPAQDRTRMTPWPSRRVADPPRPRTRRRRGGVRHIIARTP